MSDSDESAVDPISLVTDALTANTARKMDISEYIQQLEKELANVDALIAGASSNMDVPDQWDSDEEMPFAVTIPDGLRAVPPIDIDELQDPDSPFYEESRRHIQYNDLTSDRTWTDAEVRLLRDAVQREGMRQHALKLKATGTNAITALRDVPLSNYSQVKDDLDWEKIARFVPGRLPSMCRVRWLAHDHPAVTRGGWTEEERFYLYTAVKDASRGPPLSSGEASMEVDQDEETASIDWELVALFLGTGRVAADCMKAYRSAEGKAAPTVWTPELDTNLLDAVKKYGANNMTAVAFAMPIALNRQQCQSRYSVLTKVRTVGKWSKEEDEALERICDEIPDGTKNRWLLVAKAMTEAGQQRTDRQCRERWQNVLDQSMKREAWTEEEDQILKDALVADSKPDAQKLAKELNRPSTAIRRRMAAFSKGESTRRRAKKKASAVTPATSTPTTPAQESRSVTPPPAEELMES